MTNMLQKFRLKSSKGFTLIELLVVIAIIGLLAGIVLVSLNSARDGAKDARIKSAMQQTKSLAELVYNNDSLLRYDSLCSGGVLDGTHATYGTQIGNLASDIDAQNESAAAAQCYAADDAYCVSSALASTGTYCIDATGNTGSSACGGATACP